jgi:hypothetical protein
MQAATQFTSKEFQLNARKQQAVAFKHKHKIHQQKMTKYISNKDAAYMEQMLKDPETLKKKAIIPKPIHIM